MSWESNKDRDRRETSFLRTPIKFAYYQFGGQVMTFAWSLLLLGTALVLSGKLTAEWIALAGIVQALVTFRAIGEDAYVTRTKIASNGGKDHPSDGRATP